jgi:hypothetical protein
MDEETAVAQRPMRASRPEVSPGRPGWDTRRGVRATPCEKARASAPADYEGGAASELDWKLAVMRRSAICRRFSILRGVDLRSAVIRRSAGSATPG